MQTFENRAHIHATSDFIATSNSIRINIKEIAKRYGVDVIDTTDDIKAFAAHEIIHGPNDWNHFNRRGYEIFSESIVKHLPELDQGNPSVLKKR